ncbi:unnamed protein product [Caenorhabditis sp. 36 PRJEB53466]|nr:unnamed protein product [Caenorhabditis sp. 36 PRJEB53466]
MSNEELEMVLDSSECNPTVFSVFVSGMLRKMNIWENVAYLLIVVIGSVFTCLCLTIVARSTSFHSNLQAPIWCTAFTYFELAASKIITIVFQVVYLSEDNVATGGLSLIAWSAATHYHFIFSVLAFPLVVVIERTLATRFLFDYEKMKRRHILVLMLLFQYSFGCALTCLTVLNYLRYVSAGVLAGAISFGSLLVFLHINRVNKSTLKFVETKNRDVKFGLSVRYQLRENVKTFQMLKKLFVTFTALIVIIAFLKTIPMIMEVKASSKYAFREVTDMTVHAGPIYITITLICAVEGYRNVFLKMLGYQKRKVVPRDLELRRKEEEIYFEQLMQSLK